MGGVFANYVTELSFILPSESWISTISNAEVH